jgi:hypothetical protein
MPETVQSSPDWALRTASSDVASPTSRTKDLADRAGCSAWLEHLSPAESQRELSRGSTAEITIEVVPSIGGGVVNETSIKLDNEGLGRVLDVALHARTIHTVGQLASRERQSVRAFDVS